MRNNRKTYDEYYWQYKNYVVLSLRKYMYIGYDDSARVLSYLLGYKLFDTFEGIAASGPDKEKIMGVLSTHHVNYVITEFGSISDIRSFEDNRFNTYLKLTSGIKPLSHENSRHIGSQPEEDESPLPEQQPVPEQTPDWFALGIMAFHPVFGSGEITDIKNNIFTVMFGFNIEKKFVYPSAFDNGFITIVDSNDV